MLEDVLRRRSVDMRLGRMSYVCVCARANVCVLVCVLVSSYE